MWCLFQLCLFHVAAGVDTSKISMPWLLLLMGTISYLHNSSRSLLSHVVNGILVSKPIRSLHGVIEMPPPVILLHIPQSCIDPTLLTRAALDKSANTTTQETRCNNLR